MEENLTVLSFTCSS